MMKNLSKSTIALATLLMSSMIAQAQNPGNLDLEFGNNGITISDNLGANGEIYNDVIALSDDKILMVGYSDTDNQDIILAKFNADGTPDESFGNEGFVAIDATIGEDEQGWAITELPDGKLLVTGVILHPEAWNGFIMRLNSNGTMDTSFGTSSGFTEFNGGDESVALGSDVVSQNGNDIFVGATVMVDGQMDMAVFKFTQGGGVVDAFATDGAAYYTGNGGTEELSAIALSESGDIFLAGASESEETDRGVIVKLSPFGTPTTFGTGGQFVFDEDPDRNIITDLALTNEGKIVAVGTSGSYPDVDGYIFRLDDEGDLDPTFSDDGYQTTDPGVSVAMRLTNVFLPNSGGVLATGYLSGGDTHESYAFMMTEDGTPNINFGDNGDKSIPLPGQVSNLFARGAAMQSDGGVIIGGDFQTQEIIDNRLYLIRLHGIQPDGIFESAEKLEYKVFPNPTSQSFSLDFDTDKYLDSISLVDLNGVTVSQWTNRQLKYDIPNALPNGIYLIKVNSNDYVYVTKLMVTK